MDPSGKTEFVELTPWVESLVLDYSGPEEEEQRARSVSSTSGGIVARAIEVGQMSMSQVRARGSDGPIELLFLSDGVLKIPAVFTAAAWDYLQDQDDRESFHSFLNSTVFVQDYRLRFHMDQELTKCRFYLSLGMARTSGTEQFQDDSRCCTTRPSIKTKICQTWRSLLGQEDSQRSQCELDLSELLGAWKHDSLQEVLEDVKNRLKNPPRPSKSPHSTCLNWSTSWDIDRVRYRRERPFSTPVRFLLILEGPESRTQTGPESVDDADWQIPDLTGVELVRGPVKSSPVPEEDMTDRPLSNPWDMFPPPCISSSPEPVLDHPGASSGPVPGVSPTPGPGATSGPGPDPLSLLPPYQNPPTRSLPVSSSPSSIQSPAEPPGSDRTQIPAGLQTRPTLDCNHEVREDPGHYRKPKRKRCDVTPEIGREWAGPSQSPPSWLVTQTFRTKEDSGPQQAVPRRTPNIHEDGVAFSYTYTVSGQNLQDFSRFQVADPVLRWALRYLLNPEPTGAPPDVR